MADTISPVLIAGADTQIGPDPGVAGVTVIVDRVVVATTSAGAVTLFTGADTTVDSGETILAVISPANDTLDLSDLALNAPEGGEMHIKCAGGSPVGAVYFHLDRRLGTG